MGDWTTANFRVATADLQSVRRLLLGDEDQSFSNEDELEDGTTWFSMHDVNYAGENQIETLQAAGIPLVVQHDSGGSYGAGEVVFDGTTKALVEVCDAGIVVAFVEELDSVREEDIKAARDFVALKKRALDIMRAR